MSHDFALFVYEHYYPEGGWHDLDGIFKTVVEAMERGEDAAGSGATVSRRDVSAHIVHMQERRIIARGSWEHVPSNRTGQPGTYFFAWKAAET